MTSAAVCVVLVEPLLFVVAASVAVVGVSVTGFLVSAGEQHFTFAVFVGVEPQLHLLVEKSGFNL